MHTPLPDYTFTNGTSADLAVVPTLKRNKKTGKQQRTGLIYVLIHLDWSARKAQQRYRRRFGIEASFRQLGLVRAHTNSRNPALRFFYLALALFLVNLWVYLRCLCTRVLGKGSFRVDLNRSVSLVSSPFCGALLNKPTELPYPSQFIRVSPIRDSLRLLKYVMYHSSATWVNLERVMNLKANSTHK